MGCGRLSSHLQMLFTAAQCAWDFVFYMNTKSVTEKIHFPWISFKTLNLSFSKEFC